MASIEVDGVRIPVTVAGHPALDFCNTRAAWGSPTPKEYLTSQRALAVWARENGLPSLIADSTSVVERAIAFRSALYGVLIEGSADWSGVNAEVRRAGEVAAVGVDGWTLSPLADAELPLLAVVWSAAQFLVTPAARTVSACPMPDCGWVFPNPTGRRRWCSMAMCGNRAKARRHAARTRSG